jgi:hypothetical protein
MIKWSQTEKIVISKKALLISRAMLILYSRLIEDGKLNMSMVEKLVWRVAKKVPALTMK